LVFILQITEKLIPNISNISSHTWHHISLLHSNEQPPNYICYKLRNWFMAS